jgi:hypothetical protein
MKKRFAVVNAGNGNWIVHDRVTDTYVMETEGWSREGANKFVRSQNATNETNCNIKEQPKGP